MNELQKEGESVVDTLERIRREEIAAREKKIAEEQQEKTAPQPKIVDVTPEPEPKPQPEPEPEPQENNPVELNNEPNEEEHEVPAPKPDVNDIDYKAFYDKVTAPVRARGKDFTFTDPVDIHALMSKGIDYQVKMERLNKDKGVISLIRNAGLSDDVLRSLIDVAKGDKDAVLFWANKADIDLADLDDIDGENKAEYQPKTQAVSPQDAAFNDAISSAQEAGAAGNMVLSWLGQLPEVDLAKLYQNPGNIGVLVDHAQKGIFQTVRAGMDHLAVVGKLDVSNGYLHAYDAVFRQQVNDGVYAPRQTEQPVQPPIVTPPKPIPANEQRRKQVGPTRSVTPKTRTTPSKGLTMAEIHAIKDPVKFQEEFSKFQKAQHMSETNG